jgi:hypothetical protein
VTDPIFGKIYLLTHRASGKRYVGQTSGTVRGRIAAGVKGRAKMAAQGWPHLRKINKRRKAQGAAA